MFNMELKTLRPIKDYIINTSYDKEYDPELDDGRSVIFDICEIFYNTKQVLFNVSGFGDENWAVDCLFDLPVIIEQLPEIISKLKNYDFNFKLDFYEQGIERELDFKDNNGTVFIVCTSKNFWLPTNNKIEMRKEDIHKIFNNLYQNFLSYSKLFCNNLSNNILLKEWLKIE